MRKLVACLILAAAAVVADAGSCVGYQTGTVCDRYIASGQTQYYDLGSAINMSKIPDIFSQIESFGLCNNCVHNVKTYICQLVYPTCTRIVIFDAPSVPDKASCEAALSSCTPNDTPSELRPIIQAAFSNALKNLGGASDCAAIYTSDLSQAPTRSIMSSLRLVQDCNCTVPPATFCQGAITYPVWTGVFGVLRTVEVQLQSSFNTANSSFAFIPGATCANCTTQLKNTLCTAAFPRCSRDRVFIPACRAVLEDSYRACSIRELGLTSLFAPFESNFTAIPSGVATITNRTQTVDRGVVTFAINGSIACHIGSYTPSPCNCETYASGLTCNGQSLNIDLPPEDPPVNPPKSQGAAPVAATSNIASDTVPVAAIAVPIALVVVIIPAIIIGLLYFKKMWIFKVHAPDPRMFEG